MDNELNIDDQMGYDEFSRKMIEVVKKGLEVYKQIKEQKESHRVGKEWVIESFVHNDLDADEAFILQPNGRYKSKRWGDEDFDYQQLAANELGKTYPIHSVRRLSDGQIFSVGDDVDGGKIRKFVLITEANRQTDVCAAFDNSVGQIAAAVTIPLPNVLLKDLRKAPERKVPEIDVAPDKVIVTVNGKDYEYKPVTR